MSTPAKDLRTFLAQVKERFPDELVHVHRDVDLKFEISAVLVKLDRAHKFPIVVFDNLATASGGRSAFPLLSNLFASRNLCALSLDSTVEKVGLDYDRRTQNAKAPVGVGRRAQAPVKQVVKKGGDVNLFDFPVPLPYHMEGGRTILGSVVTTVDNHGDNIYNCAYQTLRVLEPRKATVGLGEQTGNWERYRERVAETGEGLPVVAWIGHHPAACMGALTRVSLDVDEYGVIGWARGVRKGGVAVGARGEPLRVTRSEPGGDKFLAPADAEIVIEGVIPPKE